MFRKILIANRGEIAIRIIRTCKKLGIKTVAVYSDPDLESQHVIHANEAYNIGPGQPSESYLNIPKIVKVAKASKAEAVHPGYGFLAENPQFARECEEVGLVFIGPRSKILASAANKFGSRETADRAGVPTIPGSKHQLETADEAENEARRVGFPILIKASFGGGGRGMRLVKTESKLRRSFDLAASEAKGAFGRSELYLEKHLKNPRHIEVQVIAGRRGQVVHLGERECSLQRRHQKILEETPAPRLDSKSRKKLISLALKIARATKYENAGTVEFVRSTGGEFYYLETNKRIQVEHLITEMVTGVDIVEQQIRIADGEGLGFSQEEIEFKGVAMNCRINAEDPSRGFATQRLKGALSETIIIGVETTIPLHQTILEDKSFVRGDYHTQLLDNKISTWNFKPQLSKEEVAMLHLTANYPLSGISKSQLDRTQTRWRNTLQTEPSPRQPLFVEGL
ncbi:ATP-grasp domain-containing protein [Candidatus Bathyarchaeota archaeon]|nr:MAG: ATP-grasp domain-containing protein [Candidatus Bathyarchaeota archaeon]